MARRLGCAGVKAAVAWLCNGGGKRGDTLILVNADICSAAPRFALVAAAVLEANILMDY